MKKDFVKKIFICLVAFVASFFCATPLFKLDVFALTNISNFNNDNDMLVWEDDGENIVDITYPDGSHLVTPLNASMGSSNNGQIQILFQPDTKDNYLGTISYEPADILNLGFEITFYLPRYVDGAYETTFTRPVTLRFGSSYGSYGVLGSNLTYMGVRSTTYEPSSGNYFSFLLWNLKSYNNTTVYSGEYDQYDYTSVQYLAYVLQTLKYLQANNSSGFNSNANFWVYGQFRGDAFANVDTEEFLLIKNTVQNIVSEGNSEIKAELDVILSQQQETQELIDELVQLQDDMLHYGEGSFDEMGNEMDSIVGDINNSNDIIGNVDRVEPDDAESAVDDVINDILSNEQASSVLNKIMSLLTSIGVVNTLILISLATGLIKYIFFGRGA